MNAPGGPIPHQQSICHFIRKDMPLYRMAKKGQAQPTRDTAMNSNSPNYNPTSGNAKKSRK